MWIWMMLAYAAPTPPSSGALLLDGRELSVKGVVPVAEQHLSDDSVLDIDADEDGWAWVLLSNGCVVGLTASIRVTDIHRIQAGCSTPVGEQMARLESNATYTGKDRIAGVQSRQSASTQLNRRGPSKLRVSQPQRPNAKPAATATAPAPPPAPPVAEPMEELVEDTGGGFTTDDFAKEEVAEEVGPLSLEQCLGEWADEHDVERPVSLKVRKEGLRIKGYPTAPDCLAGAMQRAGLRKTTLVLP